MATITKGYTFATNELVTAAKLHQLIDAATITGLDTSDFSGTVRGIETSPPSGPPEGAAWSERESRTFDGQTTSEHLFKIQTVAGAVALFHPYGLESIRLYCSADDSPQPAGCAMMSDRTGGGGATLIGGGDNNAGHLPFVIGSPRATVATGNPIRLVLVGLAGIYRAGATGSSAPNKWASTGFRIGTANTWQATTASNTNGTAAVLLSHNPGFVPGYLLGAPLWRR